MRLFNQSKNSYTKLS